MVIINLCILWRKLSKCNNNINKLNMNCWKFHNSVDIDQQSSNQVASTRSQPGTNCQYPSDQQSDLLTDIQYIPFLSDSG